MQFPVLEILPQARQAIAKNPVVILQAPPGAGKSTVLPLELLNDTWLQGKKIIMLEPRRLAAKTVATRMANLLNDTPGNRIGYRIRFETKLSAQTQLEVVTEGILTRLIQNDNALEAYGLVIFDEFHERSLHADLALALCLQVQQLLRPDLRILIMSATLDGEKLSRQLGNAPIITSLGKQYPIEHRYQAFDTTKPFVNQLASLVKKAFRESEGDMLVFLPGAGEINRAHDILAAEIPGAEIFPLFGDLSFQQQQKAIMPNSAGLRKVILSTAIAETSLTIEGIKVVVDGGLARVPRFDPRSGMTKLLTQKVSRDSADQRAGRAGRLGPGICYRLWAEHQTQHLAPTRKPEILEADLAPLLLELFAWGVADVQELQWMDAPPKGAVASALSLLTELEAVEENKITLRGKQMAAMPTHPRLAHMLLFAQDRSTEALALACDVAALLEEKDPAASGAGADLSLRVELLQRFRKADRVPDKNLLERIERMAASWRQWFKVKANTLTATDVQHSTGVLLAAAYPERIARQQKKGSQQYKMANGRIMKLEPHDPLLHFEWLAIADADLGTQEGKIFIAAPLDVSDLKALEHTVVSLRWDEEKEMVVALRETRVGTLALKTAPMPLPSQEKVNTILAEQIRLRGLKWCGWNEPESHLQARILTLKKWRPQEPWPDVSDESFLQNIEQWLFPFLLTAYKKTDLVKLDWQQILKNTLTWEQQNQLDTLAPARIPVPSGSQIKIEYYADGRTPELPVRLQELFGLEDTPTINQGQVRLMVQLLSPAYRPVQVTQDLKSFWNNAYHEVRKELRARYPKHSWPEDPWTAEAVRGARRRG